MTWLIPDVFPASLPPGAGAWVGLVAADGRLQSRTIGLPDASQVRFQLGSIAKLVTALTVDVLRCQGQLTLADRILPSGPVTLRHLLTHTAGLPDTLQSGSLDVAPSVDACLFPPDRVFSYTNLGFALLGAWLEQQTGEPLADLVWRLVFAPYGMSQARFDRSPWAAAGGLTATGQDVAQLLGGLLRSPAQLAALLATTVNVPSRPGLAAGLGCFRRQRGEVRLVEHEGFIDDSAGVVCLVPEQGWGYAVLTKSWPHRLRHTLDRLEAAWFGQRPATETRLTRLPREDHERYVGEYVNGPRRLRIASRGDTLYLERQGMALPLVRAAPDRLAVAVPLPNKPSDVTVLLDDDGRAFGLYPFGSLRALGRLLG
ncbi:MAG: serine hydrolase domain-containing protein [Chloracidobacterium sp.]